MKKITTLFSLSLLFISIQTNSQENPFIEPYSFTHTVATSIPKISMPIHDFETDIKEAELFENNHREF